MTQIKKESMIPACLRNSSISVNEVDLADQLWGSLEPLNDPALFAQADVNGESGLIEWPNGLDLPLDMVLL